jgi:Cys-tRNA(Pro)/Cys-tRNA(Cys) deacylase
MARQTLSDQKGKDLVTDPRKLARRPDKMAYVSYQSKTGNERKGSPTPATTVLRRAGVRYRLHPYDHQPAARSYGMEAAEALGVSAAQVFKTLLADVDEYLVVAVVPVCGSLDLKALASARKGKDAVMAASAAAERATGYVVGGISPLGQRKRLPTVIDNSALEYATIYVSAGRRGLDIELSPTDLIRLTSATTARIARVG